MAYSRKPAIHTDLIENLIPTPKKARTRKWDLAHPAFRYRLTDNTIGPQLSAIAVKEKQTLDDMVTAWVRLALDHEDSIPWDALPLHKRANLIADSGRWEIKESGWPRELPPPITRRNHKKTESERRKIQSDRNSYLVRYRFPSDVNERIRALAEQKFGAPTGRSDGRVGVVLTALLRFAIEQYRIGRLQHSPWTQTVRVDKEWELRDSWENPKSF